MQWRDQRSNVFNFQGSLCGYPICGKVFIDRGSEEGSVDKEFERDGLVIAQEIVDQSRKGISFQA